MSQAEAAGPTIPALVRSAADAYGERTALIDGEVRFTFADLGAAVLDVARAIVAQGIEPGERIGIWAPNSHRFILGALGALSAGCVVVPLNTRYRGPEVHDLLARTDARALLVWQGFLGYDHVGSLVAEAPLASLDLVVDLATTRSAAATAPPGTRLLGWSEFLDGASAVSESAALARIAAVRPDDLSEIIFTSGTTGVAKGVKLTHVNAMMLYRPYGQIWGLRPGDRYLLSLPLFHTGGNKAGMIVSLMYGVTMVPLAVFDTVTAMDTIERQRITVMNAPPTVYSSILDHPRRGSYDLSSLRLAATGAAVVPTAMVERALTELPFENFVTAYGLTECCGTATMCRADDSPRTVAETNGRALPGVELRVVDDMGLDVAVGVAGEVLIRGANVTRGFWRDPEATAAAIDPEGWLRTGDVGTLDAAGNLKITDRIKDLFIVGGFNVSPAEVEQVMARHPDISEVAVVGVADERLGEVAQAYVIVKPDHRLAAADLIGWCREQLANFKVPRTIVFVDRLPRNASGKVLKRELRTTAAQVIP